jgi:metallophosphoesterase (TIGR00282 family)
MKILFLGDIVGRAAREAVVRQVPIWRKQYALDFVIVNGENAAGGFGITPKIADDLFDAGVDVVSTGNHVWDQQAIQGYIADEARLLRPCNFPDGTPGRGAGLFQAGDYQVLVVNVMGALFMETLDDPFACIERELAACPLGEVADAIIVDMHAEATSEKKAMGHFCDGRASLVVGTHTHVPTADAQILPHGTAYQTDAGMCGDYNSVIGMEKDEPLSRFTTKLRGGRFAPAQDTPSLCGVIVETDNKTGLATSISPLRAGGRLSSAAPTG